MEQVLTILCATIGYNVFRCCSWLLGVLSPFWLFVTLGAYILSDYCGFRGFLHFSFLVSSWLLCSDRRSRVRKMDRMFARTSFRFQLS